MALPTILVDSATGSDSAASGAGPSSAISGSNGRTRNEAGSLHVGFFEGSAPDLSGIATDGSHVLYIAISTAGQRNFSAIVGKKDTEQSGSDAAITSGNNQVTVGSTSGWAADDVVKIAGAGAAGADLYSRVSAVNSGTVATLFDTAGTTVSGANWVNAKKVQLNSSQGLNTGATLTAWAIGGKRASIGGTNSKKLFDNNSAAGDAMPGWSVEMQSGHSETIAATITIRRSGSTTDGRITLRGQPSPSTVPVLTFSNNGASFELFASYLLCRDFELKNSNATKTASVGFTWTASTGSGNSLYGLRCNDAAKNFYKFAVIVNAQPQLTIEHCTIGHTTSNSIDITSGSGFRINWNVIYSSSGSGIAIGSPTYGIVVFGNVIAACSGNGISCASTMSPVFIVNNTIYNNGGSGIEFTGAQSNGSQVSVVNNIISHNTGYGVKFSNAASTAINLSVFSVNIYGNAVYNNTGGAYLPSGHDVDGSSSDPQFTNAAGGDFSIGTNLKAKGYPLGGTLPIGKYGSTYSYVDPGAAQRQEAGGGSILRPVGLGGCLV